MGEFVKGEKLKIGMAGVVVDSAWRVKAKVVAGLEGNFGMIGLEFGDESLGHGYLFRPGRRCLA